MAVDHAQILANFSSLQDQPLSIISLSEPISASHTANRNSNVSTDAFENPSPASLEADLSHYKELFSKLRFSYLEQVTKEKFLRSIVGDPPLIVEPAENTELEAQLADVKVVLKEQKAAVAKMVLELEARGRDLARRYETITLQTIPLSHLPSQISALQSTLTNLRSLPHSASPSSSSPNLTLPLPATLSLLAERESELAQLNQQLKTLQQALPRKLKELEKVENELRIVEAQRDGVTIGAREAIRRREDGGGGDDLERRGRWLKGVEAGLRGMLEVEG